MGLSACGGSGASLSSAPAPLITGGSPTTTPASSANIPAAGIALASDQPFKTLGVSFGDQQAGSTVAPAEFETVDFRYIAAENVYEISVPGFAAGRLQTIAYSPGQRGGMAWSEVTAGQSSTVQDMHVSTYTPATPQRALTYTSFGSWGGYKSTAGNGEPVETVGQFVYGIPTAVNDIPLSGTASYSANIIGAIAEGNWGATGADGSAKFQFDFAAGTLSGSMHPVLHDAWFTYDLGLYTFKDTVFSRGSQTFSGSFEVPRLPGAASLSRAHSPARRQLN
jgi:hypothetical protein